jgi:hypothetical protein
MAHRFYYTQQDPFQSSSITTFMLASLYCYAHSRVAMVLFVMSLWWYFGVVVCLFRVIAEIIIIVSYCLLCRDCSFSSRVSTDSVSLLLLQHGHDECVQVVDWVLGGKTVATRID